MARRSSGGPDGIVVIDKAAGWTSHDVVAKSRGILGTRKVGHSGTLDPDATGVLVLGVGRATRVLRFLQLLNKTYEATIQFGADTSTLDAAGEVVATYDMSVVTAAEVHHAALAFVGDILQVPPMVSALKVDGRRLHELAREGIEVERAARPVRVGRFDLTSTDDPLVWRAVVDCSSGTYIRSLAEDLGHALGGGGHLTALRRTAVGHFTIDEAHDLETPELLAMSEAARGFQVRQVDESVVARILVGAVLEREVLDAAGDGPWFVVGPAGELLAVYEPHRHVGMVKPSVVLATPVAG